MELWMKCLFLGFFMTVTTARSIRFKREVNSTTSANALLDHLEDANCSCDWRFLRHYEAKGCKPIEQENHCGCPEKFDCPSDNEIEENDKVCIYRGKEYATGTIINTTNPCQICRCSGGSSASEANVICSFVECREIAIDLPIGCYFVYEKDKCCPVKTECSDKSDEKLRAESFTCEYGGQNYPVGARIYPEDDPCQICICSENWNGINNSSCYHQDCVLERNKVQLKQGCIPIYHENTCCPIEFYCTSDEEFNTNITSLQLDLNEDGSKCSFGGQLYEIGKTLSIKHSTNCVTCTCHVPPDFTCIHQSCPPPPKQENCYPYYSSDACCPQYECSLGDDANIGTLMDDEVDSKEVNEEKVVKIRRPDSENPCSDVECDEDQECVLREVMCGNIACPPVPTCITTNKNCPTPMCAPGCFVSYEDANKCPTCICGEEVRKQVNDSKEVNEEKVVKIGPPDSENPCSDVECDEDQECVLREVMCGNIACPPVPTCITTNKNCPTPMCAPGCFVSYEDANKCPTCICGEVGKQDMKLECQLPHCVGENCRLIPGDNGCPVCKCDAPCLPIHCTPDCNVIVEKEGQCPRCVCENENTGCPTPMCESAKCRIGLHPGGLCPTCICEENGTNATGLLERETEELDELVPQMHQQHEDIEQGEGGLELEDPEDSEQYEEMFIKSENDNSERAELENMESVEMNEDKLHSQETKLDDLSESTSQFKQQEISNDQDLEQKAHNSESIIPLQDESINLNSEQTPDQKHFDITQKLEAKSHDVSGIMKLSEDMGSSLKETEEGEIEIMTLKNGSTKTNTNSDLSKSELKVITKKNETEVSQLDDTSEVANDEITGRSHGKQNKNSPEIIELNHSVTITKQVQEISTNEPNITCPPISCQGYNCHVEMKQNCPICICESKCPPPICEPGCSVHDNGDDQCSSCICHLPSEETRPEP